MKPSAIAAALLLVAMGTVSAVLADGPAPEADEVERLLGFILSFQRPDGAFAVSSTDTGAFLTPLAIQALGAAGLDPRELRAGPAGATPMEWLERNRGLYDATKATDWEKQILGISGGYMNPRSFGRTDYVLALETLMTQGTASHGLVNAYAFAIFALRSAGEPATDPTVAQTRDALLAAQNADGSWGWKAGVPGDVDMTSSVVAALVGAGLSNSSAPVQGALAWLHARQTTSGGFPSMSGDTANLQSTAWALWGLRSVGEDPAGPAWRRSDGSTPVSWLLGRVGPDGRPRHASGQVGGLWEAIDVLLGLSAPTYPAAAWFPVQSPGVVGAPRAGYPARLSAVTAADAHHWDLGDGNTLAGAEVVHTFARAGDYRVALTSRTGDYGKGRAYRTLHVAPSVPEAHFVAATEATVGQSITFDAANSRDRDGQIAAYEWSFGDGTAMESGTSPTRGHSFAEARTYTVTLSVRDNDGLGNSTIAHVAVRTAPTSGPSGPASASSTAPSPSISSPAASPSGSATPTATPTTAAPSSSPAPDPPSAPASPSPWTTSPDATPAPPVPVTAGASPTSSERPNHTASSLENASAVPIPLGADGARGNPTPLPAFLAVGALTLAAAAICGARRRRGRPPSGSENA